MSGIVGLLRGRGGWRSWALVLTTVCLTACGNDAASPSPDDDEVVIRTRIVEFSGDVLDGSVLGGSPFCAGGTVRHEFGSTDLGFPAVNVLDCGDGSLRIGFGPGPDQMGQSVQTSDWEVLSGTGSLAGSTGEGTMRVEFEPGEEVVGQETFTGVLVVP